MRVAFRLEYVRYRRLRCAARLLASLGSPSSCVFFSQVIISQRRRQEMRDRIEVLARLAHSTVVDHSTLMNHLLWQAAPPVWHRHMHPS